MVKTLVKKLLFNQVLRLFSGSQNKNAPYGAYLVCEERGIAYGDPLAPAAGGLKPKQSRRYAPFIFIFIRLAKQALLAPENKNAPYGALFWFAG